MPTTTNYGWTTPADTDLVKDGASAIRTLGTAIDTTVFNNASAAIAKTIVDAKGDLIVASGADAVARLAVGTNNHVLTADSAATNGVKWAAVSAGGMTLLSTTTLSGSSTTISSINQTYKALKILVRDADCTDVSTIFGIRLNGVTSGSYYYVAAFGADASAGGYYGASGNTSIYYGLTTTSEDYDKKHSGEIYIERYAETEYKHIVFNSYQNAGNYRGHFGVARFNSTTAISSITLFPDTGTFNSGTVYIYGVS